MYIREMSCISAQETFHESFLKGEIVEHEGNKLFAHEPSYKEIIPNGLLRRMSKIVRMSVATGMSLFERNKPVDAIIIGSSNGSVDKSLRFLNQLITYDEGTLTPTDFVQSTPNCVAGMLALMSKTTGYNTTHVNQGLSFETALLDALLLIEEGKTNTILLGGGEELSEANYTIESKREIYKKENIHHLELLNSSSSGTLPGEGVGMFIVDAQKKDQSIAKIKDVDMSSFLSKQEVIEGTTTFLTKNGLAPEDIDLVIMGKNGDTDNDLFYHELQQTLFSNSGIANYKHLTGDYYTVSALATWLAAIAVSGQSLPEVCIEVPIKKSPKNCLVYNNHEGKQHGWILVQHI